MAHAYTTKRGKNKKSKLGVRKDHQQNLERAMKSDPLANLLYDGPKDSVLTRGHIGTSCRLENTVARLQKALMDKCSNPGCSKASSSSTLSECASCHSTRYCDRECQLAHWNEHKASCKEIRKQLQEKERERQEAVTAALNALNMNGTVFTGIGNNSSYSQQSADTQQVDSSVSSKATLAEKEAEEGAEEDGDEDDEEEEEDEEEENAADKLD